MRLSLYRWPMVALLFALASCGSEADVENTIPANGQAGVDPRTVIAVRLSTSMSSTDLEKNTDPRNIIVTGDQTEGPYAGAVEPVSFGDVFNGQTVEDFRSGIRSPGGATEEEEEETEEETEPEPPDTLVFLLDDGVSFKPGERVTVRVSASVTVRGAAMDESKTFTFVVSGGSSAAEGEVFVTSTAPEKERSNVGLSPLMSANFSLPVRSATFEGGITIRGSQSGFHEAGSTLFDQGGAAVSRVSQRLSADDSFAPGETVSVAWSSAIESPNGEPLSPFLLGFQVKPGEVTGLDTGAGGWTEVEIGSESREVRRLLAGNFLGTIEDAEFVAVFAASLDLYAQTLAGAWTRTGTPLGVPGEVRGAATQDLDDDGDLDVVIVAEAGDRSRIVEFEVSDSGQLVRRGEPVEFPAKGITSVSVADLDADGVEELVVTHASRTFDPSSFPPGDELSGGGDGDGPRSTGTITFFERRVGLADGFDLGDPDSLTETVFHRIDRPIPRFESVLGLETHDLDGDGRLDLVAASAGGLLLYRNQSAPDRPFSFRRIGFLLDASGRPFAPRAWVATDADRDLDVDILSWTGAGAFFHENRQESSGGEDVRGILFESLPPEPFDARVTLKSGDRVIASNLDGDPSGTADLVVVRNTGDVELLIGSPDAVFAFESPRTFPAGGAITAWALADVNADTGLDILAASPGRIRAFITETSLVDPAVLPERSSFRLALGEDDGDTFTVMARADLMDRFSGYSLAVDYDEQRLEYLGFAIPPSFERKATFTLCPTAQGLGCSGVAGARMEYQRDTVGSPVDDVVLGTFRFRRRTVTEETTTEIVFEDFSQGGQSFTNSLSAVVGELTEVRPIDDLGDPLEISLVPPPPDPGPALSASCSVVERLAKGYRARIDWSSPAGESFAGVALRVEGELVTPDAVDWELGSFEFNDNRGGPISVTVTALGEGDDPGAPPPAAPSVSCSLVSIFQPEVVCESRTSSNIIRWTLDEHEVDRFNVYRNGQRIAIIDGQDDFVVEDRFPSQTGGDNYEVAGVIAGQEGPRGSCRGQDPSPCTTEDPAVLSAVFVRRDRPSDPNVVRFRWRNGESYDRLVARLRFRPAGGGDEVEIFAGEGLSLDGNESELVYDGDVDRGGALPGTYELTLEARVSGCPGSPGEVSSEPLVFPPVTVPAPTLDDVSFACAPEGLGNLSLSWLPLWRGFDERLTLRVVHTIAGESREFEIRDVLLSDTEFLITGLGGSFLEPLGSYRVTLAATFAGQEFTTSCGPVAFTPTVSVPDVEAGIGLPSFEIPVLASGVFSTIDELELDLEYPDFVTIDGHDATPAGPGRQSITVSLPAADIDPDADGDRRTAGNVELLRLRASVPPDFALVERSGEAIEVLGARLRFAGSGALRDVTVVDGRLLLRERYAVIDRAATSAAGRDPVRVAVRATFRPPPGASDYKFNAFQIHLSFDPRELRLLPPADEDQAATAVGGEGFYILPGPQALEEANRTGKVKTAWIGFNFQNPREPAFLEPVLDEEVLVLFFESRLDDNSPEVFSRISFVTDPSADQPTAFFPVEDIPGVPDMEAFFPGGVELGSSVPLLRVAALEPDRGALTGGNSVTLFGKGFPESEDPGLSVVLVPPAGEEIPADPASIEVVSPNELRFTAPDSGLRARSFAGARLHDVRVETSFGSSTLAGAYAYEAPRLIGSDVQSVRAAGSDLLRLSGVGLSIDARVEFRVDGFASPFEAEVFRRRADGTELIIIASGLPAPGAGEDALLADLRVIQPETAPLVLPERVRILPPSEVSGFGITRVSPRQATYCGGTVITVEGDGFTVDSTVTFGGVPAAGLEFINSKEIRAVVPSFDSPASVMLLVRDGLRVADAPFEIVPPRDFIRGDVDGSGAVNITDASVLSDRILNGADPASDQNRDAWDVNDDGEINFGDVTAILNFLFGDATPPAAPFPEPGQDPDNLADGICE